MQVTKDSIGDLKEFRIRSFGFGFGQHLVKPWTPNHFWRRQKEQWTANSTLFNLQCTILHGTGEFNTICYWGGMHKDCNYSCWKAISCAVSMTTGTISMTTQTDRYSNDYFWHRGLVLTSWALEEQSKVDPKCDCRLKSNSGSRAVGFPTVCFGTQKWVPARMAAMNIVISFLQQCIAYVPCLLHLIIEDWKLDVEAVGYFGTILGHICWNSL